jgi:glycosyltransferase involved in cell wall biosynthesis
MTDVHPRILLLETPSNGAAIHAMQGLRQRLLIELPLLAFSGIAGLALILWRAGRAKREQGGNTPTVLLVGPLPPPSGGMANQCRQLREFLTADGVPVEFVQTNAPYRPEWVGKARGVRAAFRLLPYLVRTWVGLGRSDVVHVFANSGMAWYLFALPVLVLARVRQVPCIINYRGGEARQFFAAAPGWVRRSPGLATTIVVPSGYLAAVFREFGFACTVVPNIIDLARFRPPSADEGHGAAPHVVVTRNLEDIYDIPTALRAFTLICAEFPAARLTVAGSGPEEAKLRALAEALGLADRVHFSGRIDNREIPALYASASLMLNPSRVDNMPISILEALASGVPVVSTDVGGIPFVVVDKESALLVPAGDAEGMAAAALSVLRDPALRNQLTRNGFALVEAYSWDRVRASWMAVYARLAGTGEVTANA